MVSISSLFSSLLLFSLFALITDAHPLIRQDSNKQCPLSSACFAIDQSGSIEGSYDQEVAFVNDIATELDNVAASITFSAVGFSDNSRLINPGESDLQTFTQSVQDFDPTPFRGTNIRAGLQGCLDNIKGESGIRVIILITDGKSDGNPLPLADMIKQMSDTYIFTVGIEPGANTSVLQMIASGPEFALSTKFSDLPDKVKEVVGGICDNIQTSCEQAYDECDFRFVGINELPTFNADVPADKAFTPRVISTAADETLGVLNQNNIVPEFIFDDGTVAPITDFGNQKFTPTHFKPFSIAGTTGSGVGHEVFQSNQLQVAKDKCVRMYFTHYQTLFPGTGDVMGNMNDVERSMNKCVVFRTAA